MLIIIYNIANRINQPLNFIIYHQTDIYPILCSNLIGSRRNTQPTPIRKHTVAITVGPRARRQIQKRSHNILRRSRSFSRNLVQRKRPLLSRILTLIQISRQISGEHYHLRQYSAHFNFAIRKRKRSLLHPGQRTFARIRYGTK